MSIHAAKHEALEEHVGCSKTRGAVVLEGKVVELNFQE